MVLSNETVLIEQ